MNIVVLGASGMLGRCVYEQLQAAGHVVVPVVRTASIRWPHAISTDLRSRVAVKAVVRDFDWVVNCAGIVKSRDLPQDAILVNAAMPHWLEEMTTRVLHVSTDCIFDGVKGGYTECSEPSPVDIYGATKLAGELRGPFSITLRTSFIGWEYGTERGLLAWFVRQAKEGKKIDGYMNALWSGLSAREVARGISRVLQVNPVNGGFFHISGETISKYELLYLLREHLKLDVKIEPVEKPFIDRSLDSTLFQETFDYHPPKWTTMAAELASEAP